MKKTTKTLATIIMLSAMVGFMGCTTSLGEDEKTPPVPVQPAEPDTPSTPGDQEKPGNPDGQGTEGTEKPGETTKPGGSGGSDDSTEQGGEHQTVTPVGPQNTEKENIVTFGQWPQTMKDNSVTINEAETTTYMGWECYKGSDDAYYVKRDAKVNSSIISTYKGPVKDGLCYFKIEPIEWRVLTDNYNGTSTKLLFSEKQLDAMNYSATSNQYDISEVRKFLINDFYNKAFSEGEKAAIATTVVDNSNASTIGSGQETGIKNETLCENTEDKVFLLSLSEMTNAAYGFDKFNDTKIQPSTMSRTKASTDYTVATETWIRTNDTSNKYNGNGCYWLRSPVIEKASQCVQIIGEDGRNGTSPIDGLFGIAPALTVPANL